jgi:hypothetical protein
MPDPISVKIGGEWQESSPADWPERLHARVNVGMTQAEKAQRIQGLTAMMAQQEQWIEKGQEGVITDKKKLYNAAADWIRAADITANVEEYITDPESPAAQEAAKQAAQAAQQEQAAMQEAQEAQVEAIKEIEERKDATERWKAEMEDEFDYFKVQQETEVKEAEITAKGVTDYAGLLVKQRPDKAAQG